MDVADGILRHWLVRLLYSTGTEPWTQAGIQTYSDTQEEEEEEEESAGKAKHSEGNLRGT